MALDRIVLNLNVNGKPIDYISEAEWGIPIEQIYSQNMHRVFCPVQVDKRLLPKIKESLAPVGFSKILSPMGGGLLPDPVNYRDRSAIIPLKDLGQHVGISNLQEKVQSVNDTVPILNGLMLTEEYFKPSQQFSKEGYVEDLNTIASGSYTVGADQDYATWALFCADIAATLTGNLTGTQQTATTETASNTLNNALAGYTLHFTSAVNPLGDFNSGYLSSYNMSSLTYWFNCTVTSAGAGAVIKFSNLNLKDIGSAGSYGLFSSSTFTNGIYKVNDCLLNKNSKGNSVIRTNSSETWQVYNAVIVGGGTDTALLLVGINAASVFSNMTIYGGGIGFYNYANSAVTLKNIASFGHSSGDFIYSSSATLGLGNATATACASSDQTGSPGAFRGLVAANEFVSTDITSADFLKIKATGMLSKYGVAPSLAANTYGIRGNGRPHN